MSEFAFVFPGQGSQSVGMATAVAAGSLRAAAVLEDADRALGEPLSEVMAKGPAGLLDRTEQAQPAMLATSIALLTALRERSAAVGLTLRPRFVAGHSMGQYSALVAAGAISFDDGIRLVRERGRQMQASGRGRPGAMAAIIGLDDAALPRLVARAGEHGVFEVANRNAPGQVVVSGERPAVEVAMEAARELGARRSVLLPISIAAHSPLMEDAATAMADLVARIHVVDPETPLLANATAAPITAAAGARRELVDHLTAGVDWVSAVESMTAAGVTTFVEVGPGRVLTGLIKRIAPDAMALALDDPQAPGGLSAVAVDALLAAEAGTEQGGGEVAMQRVARA